MKPVVVIGRIGRGKVGYACGRATRKSKCEWVWFPSESFPNDFRAIHRDNLRPATETEAMKLEFV